MRSRLHTRGVLALLLGSISVGGSVGCDSNRIAVNSTAGVLVWENSWAAPFASAVRHSGGQLVASGRIPIQALAAALEDEGDENEGG